MTVRAAGEFRRTPLERSDQRVSWDRPDRAFFAAGACHILAWECVDAFPDRPLGLAALRSVGSEHVFHTYATWQGWAFDASGWNAEADLVAANEAFEGRELERLVIGPDLATFCEQQWHRMPKQFHDDPRPRARAYLEQFTPPWA